MVCWWEGWSLTRMAREYGISRARVAAILAQVGCRAGQQPDRLFRGRGRGRCPDSRRGVPAARVTQARAMLMHPKAPRLTVRQRAAIAWTAMGLSSRDIAKRMGVTGQRVRSMLIAADMRLQRHARRPPDHDIVLTDHTPMPTLRWDGLLKSLTGQHAAHLEHEHAD
ncbi:MAG: hypothetical protein ACYC26_16690 [Phycisphaerales bacterium]